jgi:hypothetical protein
MSNVTVQEALKSAIDAMIMYQLKLDSTFIDEAIISCKSALSDIEKCEPVGRQFYQDGKWHNGMDTNNHKQNTIDAGFPIRELYTSPQPIEKCEPVAYMYQHEETGNIGFIDQWQVDNGFEKNNPRLKIITSLYTSPISKEWVGLSDQQIQNLIINSDNYNKFQFIKSVEHTVKQLNVPEKG